MGGQLDGNFLAGSLPRKFILIVISIICFAVNKFLYLSPPVPTLDSAGCSCECRVRSSHRRCCDCTASSAPSLPMSRLDSSLWSPLSASNPFLSTHRSHHPSFPHSFTPGLKPSFPPILPPVASFFVFFLLVRFLLLQY